jgi:eukaryotic-like serine/threonine-protein kinase
MSDVLLSRYQILQKLGSGGFGDTYLAKDIALPTHPFCVVKHLQPKDPDPSALSIAKTFFEREAECLYRLGEKSDRIPRLYAHFEENGQFYLVQEYIDGRELSEELLPGKPLTEDRTIKLLWEILEVLAIVHRENVIHRDIKPSNIMRRKCDGKLVLIDFGAVKEISALAVTSHGKTSMTVPIGTPGYMPSEQARGKPRLASDVYAVGIIGIEALTGIASDRLPEDPNTGVIIWRDRATVSDSLAQFLDKTIHEYHLSRYQNASEALQALMAIADPSVSSPLSTIPTAVVANASRKSITVSKPSKFVPIAVTLGSLAVAGGVGIALLNRPINVPQPVIVNTPTIELTPEPIPTVSPEPTPEVTIAPEPTPTSEATIDPKPEPTSQPEEPESTPTPEATETAKLNEVALVFNPPSLVRTEPTITGSILCPVRSVRKISIYGSTDSWYRTDVCGTMGYIHQSQIRFD